MKPVSSGRIGGGGDVPSTVCIDLFGSFGPGFASFAKARADALSIVGTVHVGPGSSQIVAEGPDALLGAFEMACCIGPECTKVSTWSTRSVVLTAPLMGFRIARDCPTAPMTTPSGTR